MKLIKKGLPQTVELSAPIEDSYFLENGEVALPPYIQQARGERHMRDGDESWYQTHWADEVGSCACPTASLHFDQEDLEKLKSKGVEIIPLTLHVGLGTFLPIKASNIR